jgi:hypothetical protein
MFVYQLLIVAGFLLTTGTALNVKRFRPSTDAF